MTAAPLLPFVKPAIRRPPPAACRPLSDLSVAWSPERNQPVEIVTPDRYCADLLLECAAPLVPAELLAGAGWIVRLQAPPVGSGGWWMFEVMSLLDCWLESVPIPCARVLYGGHSYLIRSSIETARPDSAPRSALAADQALAH
jgi:hypothetical protein